MSLAPFDLVARAAFGQVDPPTVPSFRLISDQGAVHALDVGQWFRHPSPEEGEVLDLALAPTLDVGCGPGRHSIALDQRGIMAVGVDVGPRMVDLARQRGATAILASVFDPLPGAGTWGSALLLDGNVGIGGDPVALLRRLRGLVRRDGRVLVETAPPGEGLRLYTVQLQGGGRTGPSFRWSTLAADRLSSISEAAGFRVVSIWEREGRWFARLDGN